MKRLTFGLLLILSILFSACSTTADSSAAKRVADKQANTRHFQGTTEALKNYRLPDVTSKTNAKATIRETPSRPGSETKAKDKSR